MRFERKRLGDWPLKQLVDWVRDVENIELSSIEQKSKPKLLARLKTAAVDIDQVHPMPIVEASTASDQGDYEDWSQPCEIDPSTERWIDFQVQPTEIDKRGTNITVSVNGDGIHVIIGRRCIAPENLVRHLMQMQKQEPPAEYELEAEPNQLQNKKFESVPRFAVSIFGPRGLVCEGPPKGVGADAIVLKPGPIRFDD